jgi:hypothetical protein
MKISTMQCLSTCCKSTKLTSCNTSTHQQRDRVHILLRGRACSTDRILLQPGRLTHFRWALSGNRARNRVANHLAQVDHSVTQMRHYDDHNGSKTLGWLRQHIMGCYKWESQRESHVQGSELPRVGTGPKLHHSGIRCWAMESTFLPV